MSAEDYLLLGIALLIDFVDALPAEAVPLPGGRAAEVGVSIVEAGFLTALGVNPLIAGGMGAADLVPLADVVPFCTLAVADRRFGVKIPLLHELYGGKK